MQGSNFCPKVPAPLNGPQQPQAQTHKRPLTDTKIDWLQPSMDKLCNGNYNGTSPRPPTGPHFRPHDHPMTPKQSPKDPHTDHATVVIIDQRNKTSSNKSSFSQYLPLFWPVWQSRAAVEPNSNLSQNNLSSNIHIAMYIQICIKRCIDRVTVFKFQVYSVNTTRCTLIYVISLCRYPSMQSKLRCCKFHQLFTHNKALVLL